MFLYVWNVIFWEREGGRGELPNPGCYDEVMVKGLLWWTSLGFLKKKTNYFIATLYHWLIEVKGLLRWIGVKELLELGCCDEVVVKKFIQIKDIIIFRLSMFLTYLCYILISNWRCILRQLNEHYFLKEPTCTCNSISREPHCVILRNVIT